MTSYCWSYDVGFHKPLRTEKLHAHHRAYCVSLEQKLQFTFSIILLISVSNTCPTGPLIFFLPGRT